MSETFRAFRIHGDERGNHRAGIETLALDVTDEPSRQRAVRIVESRFGPVYALVYGSGAPQYGAVEEVELASVRRALEASVLGFARMCQLVLPGMRRTRGGRIVVTVPEGGAQGAGMQHAMGRALACVADALRDEVRAYGVHVATVLGAPLDATLAARALGWLPHAADTSPYRALHEQLARMLAHAARGGEEKGPAVDEVAAMVLRAAADPRPDARYEIGVRGRLLWLLRGIVQTRAGGRGADGGGSEMPS